MKIKFSEIAKLEFEEIVHHLFEIYGRDKAINFSELLKQNLKQVETFPDSFGYFLETQNRKFMVTPYITIIYKVNHEFGQVEILNFWFNRSNPNVLLKHL
jgi:plasmid stabilization system protein ParE